MGGFVLSNVSKRYGDSQPIETLRDINLSIGHGEFIVILGPSGCGKSTLLELLAGLQTPSAGQLAYADAPVQGPDARFGVVFQDPSLFPWRTIVDNVAFGLETRGMARAERRRVARHQLGLVGLAEFTERYPHQLSGGMRQRAGLARALATDPEVLLMDEPYGAVDHLTRVQLQDDLLAIWAANRKTVVFVTHDVAEAAYLGDRVVVLSVRPGRISTVIDIPHPRPRERGDVALTTIQKEIYAAIGDTDGRNRSAAAP